LGGIFVNVVMFCMNSLIGHFYAAFRYKLDMLR
jgi:hypothetical protein